MPAGSEKAFTYASYLALDELLSLQRPESDEHDEVLFIVIHQVYELWFKVILHELDELVRRLERADALGAVFVVKRVNALVRIVTEQLSALETLPPQRFAEFRVHLGTSSGSQSAQFRAIEAASGLRDPHFLHALAEHGEPPALVQRWLDRPTLQELFERMLSSSGETLEREYQHFSALLQEWNQVRTQWLSEKRAQLVEKTAELQRLWQHTAASSRLKELEFALKQQSKRLHYLTLQFA